jgi:hypothetical protein
MTVAAIPVDQRVIGIDSRRFASVEKALVELITNSDDSYSREEGSGEPASGRIEITYERHLSGAIIEVTDQAEGMSFARASSILSYGGAHSPLSRGEGNARGYFGRGLKQAVFGLGHGWIETVRDGRLTHIDLFRDEAAGYLFDDHGGDRPVTEADRHRLGIEENGTRATVVVDNPNATVSHYRTVVRAIADNVYLREVLARRPVSLVHVRAGREIERSDRVRFQEPPAQVLIGPDRMETLTCQGETYDYSVTLKRALGVDLTLKGDERTNGLVVVSGPAVLDCHFFEHENQVGTEYLFGTVRCAALIEKLGQGQPIISDEREGLNHKHPFVVALSQAVSKILYAYVAIEREKLRHIERASTSDRTGHMIDQLLRRMSETAVRDLGIADPSPPGGGPVQGGPRAADPMRFTTPFYYRRPGHPFRISLLVDPDVLDGGAVQIEHTLPASMHLDPEPTTTAIDQPAGVRRLEWTVVADAPHTRGEITARSGRYWAWCEVVASDEASHSHPAAPAQHAGRNGRPASHTGRRSARDHGADLFAGYELRHLHNELDRAVYSPDERKILINTGAPTVQLYLDGRGHFRDSARLLLAELFLDVIAGELAYRLVRGAGTGDDAEAYRQAKQNIIRRYGADVHRSFA